MRRYLVMLGTDSTAPGGITAVIRMYRDGGLFARWPVRFLPTYHRAGVLNKIVSASLALVRFLFWLARGEVGWVHAHVAARGSFWRKSVFLLLGHMAGARTVFHLHDGSFPAWYEARSPWVRRLVRAVLQWSDRVLVLTPTWAQWIREIAPQARTVVVGNPVSLAGRVSLRIPGRVLFLGRLWQEKGIYDLLEAAASLKTDFPELVLVCAGDGDREAVLRRAAVLGLSQQLVLPGWVDGMQKEALLGAAAVFVLPSYFEGLPMGVLEAMASGVPVVATEVGGMRDAVGESAGVLVPAGDVAALSAALRLVLGDAALQARMGQVGRSRVAAVFETAQVIDRLGEVYSALGMQEVGRRLPDRGDRCGVCGGVE